MKLRFVMVLAVGVLLAGCATASKKTVEQTIRDNPSLVLEALKQDKMALLELVEEGAKERRLLQRVDQWRMQAADPVSPEISDDRPFLGNPNAPITIVEYSDFLCPYCSKGARTVNKIVEESDGKVRVVFKHSPRNQNAYRLALMYEAVAEQDREKAWEFGERLFEVQQQIFEKGEPVVMEIVEELGIDAQQLKKDMMSDELKARVRADSEEGAGFGVSGTPTFFVNGVKVEGAVPEEQLRKVIEIVEEVQNICTDCE
ncbi:DsbA family protein [Desulfovibrio oxyclinae]|uniref:DsbA family protein n=1 Tax=Desulfovibrio oxyclinae TaxID=63560 RepID=UPI000377B45F|nr:thioredoxin domain-containing protein [Desulfovibrio oxyclinae]